MYSPTTIIAAITSRIKRAKLPTHIAISAIRYQLEKDSVILLEQLRTIDKQRLKERIAHLDEETMEKVENALMISIGLKELS
jgi:mRNA interferase MazF